MRLSAVVLILVALAALALLHSAARSHDYPGVGDWIGQRGLRNPAGEWCCGAGDCFAVKPVQITAEGYYLPGLNELVPFAEAQPLSPDGQYWRCHRPDGKRRCFFAPPPTN